MSIGVFDSGVGGVSILNALTKRLPSADFIYLADQKNAPYGDKSGEAIVDLTQAGCKNLFDMGASIVVLACNTASAVALRRLQSSWLIELRRKYDRKINILGIIVPTIEAATGLPWEHEAERRGPKIEKLDVIGVFCTQATAKSRVYEIEIDKRRQDLAVFCEPCSGLADLIEQGAALDVLKAKVSHHVNALQSRIGRHPERAILGCTHYELIADLFKEALPALTPIIHQPPSVAEGLAVYIERHNDYVVGNSGKIRFYTSGDIGKQSALIEAFWGGSIQFEAI